MYADREALVDEICARLSKGEPLAQICRDVHMPERTVVYDWANADKDIAQRIAHARNIGYDAIADDCFVIADDTTKDYKQTKKGLAFDPEHVQRSKLRIETRLKLLAKWDPKRYGERQHVEHSGSIDSATTIIEARKRSGRG